MREAVRERVAAFVDRFYAVGQSVGQRARRADGNYDFPFGIHGDSVVAPEFGGDGLVLPLPWKMGAELIAVASSYRLVREATRIVMQSRMAAVWQDAYVFDEEPHFPVDFEVFNHYTSTHPSSRFVQTMTAQRIKPDGRYVLRNREFTILRGNESQTRVVANDDEVLNLERTMAPTDPTWDEEKLGV